MSDQNKPPSAAEIEELKDIARRYYDPEDGIQWDEALVAVRAIPRLLSMVQPPTDAAVREAVDAAEHYAMPNMAFQELINTPHLSSNHLRTLLRAVQAPSLNPMQVEAVKNARWVLRDLNYTAAANELEAAFPGLFGKEGSGDGSLSVRNGRF